MYTLIFKKMKNLPIASEYLNDKYLHLLIINKLQFSFFIILIYFYYIILIYFFYYINYLCNYSIITYFSLNVFLFSVFISILLMKNVTSSIIETYPSNLAWLFGINDQLDKSKETTRNICINQECEKIGIKNN